MNTKFLKAVAAIAVAVVASSSLVQAAAVTPADFNTQLKAKVGTKKGLSAANAAATLMGKTLKDKLNKKNADKYAKSVIKILKKSVPLSSAFSGPAVNATIKQLLIGYFTGLKFNINDKTYNKAQTSLLKGLSPTAKTAATSQSIYNTIKTFAVKKGTPADQVFTYYQGVESSNNLPPPPQS